jgi:2-C-methyl-D-erythritol 4-phosphate cytidylyltransferase
MPADASKKHFIMRCVALIPAAGTGSRVGDGCPKQYLTLLDRPMLSYSVEVLLNHPRISAVFVVISPEDDWFQRFDWRIFGTDLTIVRVGGATRSQSVANGLHAMGDAVGLDDWVLVHDAARPCLSNELLDRLIDRLGKDDVGGLLACPIADTIKSADTYNRVTETRPRDGLWGAQTPQMFRRGLLERALSETDASGITDEASALERLGYQPLLIESEMENLKVTFAGDLRLAETILKSRKDNQ